jgi:hypothetical protein
MRIASEAAPAALTARLRIAVDDNVESEELDPQRSPARARSA